QPNKAASALQLPLWVCSDCRRTVEKEDRHTALEQSLGVRRHGVTVSRCCAGRCRKFKDDGENSGLDADSECHGHVGLADPGLLLSAHSTSFFFVTSGHCGCSPGSSSGLPVHFPAAGGVQRALSSCTHHQQLSAHLAPPPAPTPVPPSPSSSIHGSQQDTSCPPRPAPLPPHPRPPAPAQFLPTPAAPYTLPSQSSSHAQQGDVLGPPLADMPLPPASSSSIGPQGEHPSLPTPIPPSCSADPDCEGHRCEGNGAYEHQPYDGEESQDDDSCSEHSSSTSTSTNQKEGKYCDCCYCEFFGHGGPPAAPTSRNYAEMREKLRLRLTKRKEEQPKREEQQPVIEPDRGVEDHRRVEDLLQFINSADNKPVSSSKAAKRARHKQKKMEEKARMEAEAHEREEQQMLEEQQRRQRQEEEEAALQKELLRLQELQHHRAAKKKKKEKAKENTAPPPNNPQPLRQTAQNVLDNLHKGKSHSLLQTLIRLPEKKEPRLEPLPPRPNTQHSPKRTSERGFSTEAKCHALLHNGTPTSSLEVTSKVKAKPSAKVATCASALKKTPELPKCSDVAAKLANGTLPRTTPDHKATRIRPAEALAPLPTTEPRREERCHSGGASGKRQHQQLQQPPTPMKEGRRSPPASNPSPSPPPASQAEQNGKAPSAESPQPKGKTKKSKKKKGEKPNSSIGWFHCPQGNGASTRSTGPQRRSSFFSDDVFLPKDIDLDSTEMDETEREVEYFKRFCLDSARQTRQRLSINWSNFTLKKATFAAH
uniref:Family with sequence similarity 193 member A n=1 Tax=Gasterosteus aculeatus TaxID=69293 RepID=G3PX88_GASAC